MTSVTLHEGDNRDHLRRLIDRGVRVHSVVCDPPYGLTSVVKRFGKQNAAPAKFGTDGAFQRQSKGFMQSTWDGSGIERDPDFWRLVHDILLPGGYCLAFSSPRTGHWMACAMELAGFVMHPFFGWCYGQGFPKAHNASKAIDRELGAERQVVGTVKRRDIRNKQGEERGSNITAAAMRDGPRYIEHAITEAATPEAAAWEGWAYGAQSIKPALEPIYVGQRPFSEKNGALNLLKHGVGALNIDGCRVATDDRLQGSGNRPLSFSEQNHDAEPRGPNVGSDLGRHPANLLHDGSDAVVALFPAAPGQIATSSSSDTRKNQNCYGEMTRGSGGVPPRADSGSAAHFFNAFPRHEPVEGPLTEAGVDALIDAGLVAELDADPLRYHGKATIRDRVTQCRLCGLHAIGRKPPCGCLDPDTGKVSTRSHPTVKPEGLMRWLVRLATPPGGVVLDPFAGSGTTGSAARAEGFDCILIEADPTFAGDIRARLGLPAPQPTAGNLEALFGIDDPLASLVG